MTPIQFRTILSVLVVLIALIVLSMLKTCDGLRSAYKLLDRDLQQNNVLKYEVGKLGLEVTKAGANYVTREDLRSGNQELVKELSAQLEGPIRTLDRTTRVLSTRVEQLVLPVHDTVEVIDGKEVELRTFTFKNEWMDLSGKCSIDKVWLDYTLRADYYLEYHWKAQKLFGPKELIVLVRSKDPNVRVDAVQQFSVVDKTPWWG